MLLPIKRPQCEKDLWKATLLAGNILNYAANYEGLGLDEEDFKANLTPGSWLMTKPRNVVTGIRDLLKLPRSERLILRQAFWNDIRYCRHLSDPNFQFLCHPKRLAPQSFAVAKKLLVAFYEDILGGAGFELPDQSCERLTIHSVEEGYHAVNAKKARVCPACLGELRRPAKGRSQVDREHYFPKSVYPALAVHPGNLTLVCKACNAPMHLEEDPIAEADHGLGELQSVLVPYERVGLREIHLQFQPGAPRRTVTLSGNGTSTFSASRVSRFDALYGLAENWSAAIESIHEDITNDIQCEYQKPTEAQVKARLTNEVNKGKRKMLVIPQSFLRMQYALWLLQPRRLSQFTLECNDRPSGARRECI